MAARVRMETVFILIVAATFCAGAVAQSSSCNNVLISMSPCLDYITGNSSTPSSSCCSQLSNVVRSQPQCLCEAISGGGSSSLGININQTQALALPNACNVQTPPASRCNGSGSGSGSSPSGTLESPSDAEKLNFLITLPLIIIPICSFCYIDIAGNGSNTGPSPNVDSSNGNATKLAFSFLVFLLFVQASYASIFNI